jgi:UDP-GlcNAc:undecaprenyl-phosphate GlcNAc-1-phosphate transferase
MGTLTLLAAAGGLALLVNLALLPLIIWVSHRRGWFDLPNGRKIHTNPIPRIGGIGIFVSFLVSVLAVPSLLSTLHVTSGGFPFGLRHIPLAAAFCLMSAIGLVDDFYNLRALLKFILQILAAVLVILGGFMIGPVRVFGSQTVSLGIAAYPLTVLWIVGLSNAMNLVDGVDGFAGGIAAFGALTMGVIALIQGSSQIALVAFALAGSVAAFLVFNFPPARIFMGDSGAYLLGFTLSVLPLLEPAGGPHVATLSAAITLLTIPVIDTLSAIVRRLRQRVSIGTPDKEHVHHKLRDIGLKDRKLVAITYAYSLLLGGASIGAILARGVGAVVIFVAAWACSLIAYFALKSAEDRSKASAAHPAGSA